jgi:hypothetical protein
MGFGRGLLSIFGENMRTVKYLAAVIATLLSMITTAQAADCGDLEGSWSNPVGGTWTFSSGSGKLVVNSTNYGSRAQQITELKISSCSDGVLKYIIERAAMTNTDDPEYTYDKVPPAKEYSQPYSLGSGELKIGNFTYMKQ